MKPDTLINQIETYSNAIVAFAVLQGLAFAYSFGTNEMFNCLVKNAAHLAEGLTALFALVTVLSVLATIALGRTAANISGEFSGLVRKIYAGKVVAVIIFSLVPLLLTVGYGVRDYEGKTDCKVAAEKKVKGT